MVKRNKNLMGAAATYMNCLTISSPSQRKNYCNKEYQGIPGLKKKCRVNNNLFRKISVIFVVIEVFHGCIKTTYLVVKENVIKYLNLVTVTKVTKDGKMFALM